MDPVFPPSRVERARAKVNLFLHVTGRRTDGWHDLESLAAFAECGDSLEAAPAADLSLAIAGPFAAALRDDAPDQPANLVIRAAQAVGIRAAFRLEKRLPVASGIGGGSADAAAALRLAARLSGRSLEEPAFLDAARALGADVPVCLKSQAAWMSGTGDQIIVAEGFPAAPALLANPGMSVETPRIFRELGLVPGAPGPSRPLGPPPRFASLEELLGFLDRTRNDLEPTAISAAPIIADALALLRALPGVRLARMSGSGATVFALFDDDAAAVAGVDRARSLRPDWWCVATRLS